MPTSVGRYHTWQPMEMAVPEEEALLPAARVLHPALKFRPGSIRPVVCSAGGGGQALHGREGDRVLLGMGGRLFACHRLPCVAVPSPRHQSSSPLAISSPH